jgi:hypothetical protein
VANTGDVEDGIVNTATMDTALGTTNAALAATGATVLNDLGAGAGVALNADSGGNACSTPAI